MDLIELAARVEGLWDRDIGPKSYGEILRRDQRKRLALRAIAKDRGDD